jgi:phosphatidylcholine synthase
MDDDKRERRERGLKTAAYGVHVFTACGAVCAVLALQATLAGRLDIAFLWLGAAFIVDGIDGTFARALNVAVRADRYDGEILDLVVDYTTYVFVPVVMLITAHLLPAGFELALASVISLTAALYFADTKMKTEEGGFLGFPACWNVVVFYLALTTPPGWVAAVVVLVFAALQFAPIAFTHPMRVRRWRALNLALVAAWTVAALVALWTWGAVPPAATVVLVLIGVWFLGVGAFGRKNGS